MFFPISMQTILEKYEEDLKEKVKSDMQYFSNMSSFFWFSSGESLLIKPVEQQNKNFC